MRSANEAAPIASAVSAEAALQDRLPALPVPQHQGGGWGHINPLCLRGVDGSTPFLHSLSGEPSPWL